MYMISLYVVLRKFVADTVINSFAYMLLIYPFLGATPPTRSIKPNSYGNVSGWLSVTAGIVSK